MEQDTLFDLSMVTEKESNRFKKTPRQAGARHKAPAEPAIDIFEAERPRALVHLHGILLVIAELKKEEAPMRLVTVQRLTSALRQELAQREARRQAAMVALNPNFDTKLVARFYEYITKRSRTFSDELVGRAFEIIGYDLVYEPYGHYNVTIRFEANGKTEYLHPSVFLKEEVGGTIFFHSCHFSHLDGLRKNLILRSEADYWAMWERMMQDCPDHLRWAVKTKPVQVSSQRCSLEMRDDGQDQGN